MHFIIALMGVYRAEIGLLILALMFVSFVRERYSPTVIAVVGACAFALLGLLNEKSLFSVFSNSAPLTVSMAGCCSTCKPAGNGNHPTKPAKPVKNTTM